MGETFEAILTFGAIALFVAAIWKGYGLYSDWLYDRVDRRKAKQASLKWMLRDERAPLEPATLRALGLGGVLAEDNGFSINVLMPAAPPADMKSWLSQWWGIHTKDDLHRELRHLLDAGHSALFDALVASAAQLPMPAATPQPSHDEMQQVARFGAALAERFGDAHPDLQEFAANLPSAHAALRAYAADLDNAPLPLTAKAYDLGRAVVVARVGAAALLHSEEEAWRFVQEAHQIASAQFSSWQAYALSYLWGRAIWGGGYAPGFEHQRAIANMLLHDARSPWRIAGWR